MTDEERDDLAHGGVCDLCFCDHERDSSSALPDAVAGGQQSGAGDGTSSNWFRRMSESFLGSSSAS